MNKVLSQEEINALFSAMCSKDPNPDERAEGEGATWRIYELMEPIPMSITAEIRNSSLTMNDLLNVSVGDIIDLNKRMDDPVYLCVGGIAKFAGRMVQRQGKKAFEISCRLSG